MSQSVFVQAFLEAQRLFPPGSKTCLEFGVGKGGSYVWQVNQIVKNFKDTTLIGFDSWCGLPDETPGVWCPGRHIRGNFAHPKSIVLDELTKIGVKNDPRFMLVDGFFDKSLTKEVQQSISNLIFVNIDVDIHSSSILALDFIKPLLKENVILYWDDWKDPIDKYDGKWGEHLAWEQWSQKNPEVKTETIVIGGSNERYMRIL